MKNIHIGEAIKQKVKERNMRISDFAAAIHCNRTNVYSIFTRKSIDIEQLILISKVLQHDFVLEFYHNHNTSQQYLIILEADQQQLQEFSSDKSIIFIKKL